MDALIDHILKSRKWMQVLFLAAATLAITALVPLMDPREDVLRRRELMGLFKEYKDFSDEFLRKAEGVVGDLGNAEGGGEPLKEVLKSREDRVNVVVGSLEGLSGEWGGGVDDGYQKVEKVVRIHQEVLDQFGSKFVHAAVELRGKEEGFERLLDERVSELRNSPGAGLGVDPKSRQQEVRGEREREVELRSNVLLKLRVFLDGFRISDKVMRVVNELSDEGNGYASLPLSDLVHVYHFLSLPLEDIEGYVEEYEDAVNNASHEERLRLLEALNATIPVSDRMRLEGDGCALQSCKLWMDLVQLNERGGKVVLEESDIEYLDDSDSLDGGGDAVVKLLREPDEVVHVYDVVTIPGLKPIIDKLKEDNEEDVASISEDPQVKLFGLPFNLRLKEWLWVFPGVGIIIVGMSCLHVWEAFRLGKGLIKEEDRNFVDNFCGSGAMGFHYGTFLGVFSCLIVFLVPVIYTFMRALAWSEGFLVFFLEEVGLMGFLVMESGPLVCFVMVLLRWLFVRRTRSILNSRNEIALVIASR